MPQGYDFVSPWAMAQQALVSYFGKQDALKRQAEIDQLNRRNVESQIADRAANRRIQEEQALSLAEMRKQSAATAAENAAKAETADVLAQSEHVPIGTDITGSAFAKRAGKIPGMVASAPVAEPIPQRQGIANLEKPEEGTTALPGVVMPNKQTFAGTREQQSEAALSRAMADNPNMSADQLRQAALGAGVPLSRLQGIVEREKPEKSTEITPYQRESLDIRRDIAANTAATQAAAAADRAARETDRRQAADEKRAAAEATNQAKRAAVVGSAEESLRAVNDLLAPTAGGQPPTLTPGAQWLYGRAGNRLAGTIATNVGGTQSAAANAALNQLLGRRIVDLLAEMKAQSRTGATGFGQLSIRELETIERAATRLGDRRISPDEAAKELATLSNKLGKIVAEPSMAAGVPAPIKPTRTGRDLGKDW